MVELIDRIRLIEELKATKKQNAISYINIIEAQPISYDPEHVIRQIELEIEGSDILIQLVNDQNPKDMQALAIFTERKRCYEHILGIVMEGKQKMTIEQAKNELRAQLDSVIGMALYMEENAPGRSLSAYKMQEEALNIAISAIEENQKYRSLGTVEGVAAAVNNWNKINERGQKER